MRGLRSIIERWKRSGYSIALVPTMGNLHDGHISLLNHARENADRTVVSIFVNPIQFGKGEDYERYPSTLAEDKNKLEKYGLDLLFTPDLEALYPGGTDSDTRINVPELSNILCGESRPDHFSGVATVVAKLLSNAQPDAAFFGEKDYQQLLVIKRMVADLCLPVEIVGLPIVRESDGVAMSSRNAYLAPDERHRAPEIYRTLKGRCRHSTQRREKPGGNRKVSYGPAGADRVQARIRQHPAHRRPEVADGAGHSLIHPCRRLARPGPAD